MTDKEINDYLNKINDSFSGKGYILNLKANPNFDEGIKENAIVFDEYMNISYMENDLNLVLRFFDEKDALINIIRLSSKGKKVIEKGGWIKYKKLEKRNNLISKIKKEVSYWFAIIIPLASLYIAYLAIKNDNRYVEDKLYELKEEQKELNTELKEQLKLLTKRVDSVSQMNYKP